MAKKQLSKRVKSLPRAKRPADLPYPFPRPALMQTWGEVSELTELRQSLMREYDADSVVVRILVHELAFYTWEIHELMKVKFSLSRRKYVENLKPILREHGIEMDSANIDKYMNRDKGISKEVDEMLSKLSVTPGEILVTGMAHYKIQFEAIDTMISAAERRRSQLLKELDRYEMARILISERKG